MQNTPHLLPSRMHHEDQGPAPSPLLGIEVAFAEGKIVAVFILGRTALPADCLSDPPVTCFFILRKAEDIFATPFSIGATNCHMMNGPLLKC